MFSRFAAAVAFVFLLTSAVSPPASATSVRRSVLLDAGWRFHLGELPGASPSGISVLRWRWKPDDRGEADAAEITAPDLNTNAEDWRDAATGEDTFHGRVGFAWFRAVLNATSLSPKGTIRLHFEGVDDNAVVYLNGRRLLRHEGWDEPFDVPVQNVWKPNGPNTLAVLVENTNGMGGIIGPVALQSEDTTATGAAAPSYDDSQWRRVDVPHDWVVEQPFDEHADAGHGFHPTGIAWYRKTFSISGGDRGKRLTLEFGGIYRNSRLWLNGHYLGTHLSGYTSFFYDITHSARYGGKNLLAVRVDASRNEGWWYEGGGIYRHVRLVETAPLHVAHWGTFVRSQVPENGPNAYREADVRIATTVANETAQQSPFRLVSQLLDAAGREVGSSQSRATLPAEQSRDIAQRVRLKHPRLWSLETPTLYTLRTTIEQNGRVVDTVTTPFGIRTIRFDPNRGFFLNGKPVKIKGTCNHQDFASIGIALPDRVHVYKLEKLKAMGSNAYRCSHHPYASELLDACDRMGMLVMDENRRLGDSPEILGQVESMVRRDRNHPSIIMWSMCNEEPAQGTERGAKMFQAMKQVVRSLDTTRPITCAMNGGWGHGISLVEDLQGCNYNPGGYDAFHKAFPDQPMFGSETASTVGTRGIYADDPIRGYVSAYRLTDDTWKPIAERPFMAGSFVWTGFDYRGEPTPYGWPCINSHFGIMDTCGFPKDNYYYYLAWWGDRPVVHIMPHWNWAGKEGQEITVRCFSNCRRVELFLNGQSLGVQTMPRNGHLDWKVAYAPGKLEARGYNGGTQAAADVVETTGAPAALRLHPDRTKIRADNEDVSIIEVSVLDSAGRTVPTADNLVTFNLRGGGKILGVGNGDPSDHEPDKATQRHAFNGRCLVIVQAGSHPGRFVLTASSPGLRQTNLILHAR